jgi:hypothetical protein
MLNLERWDWPELSPEQQLSGAPYFLRARRCFAYVNVG